MRIFIAALLVTVAAGPALAKPPVVNAASSEAREHYLEGTKYFDLTQYPEAIKEFEAAYKAKPDPAFLYNIAQSYRLDGQLDKAARFYRNYLRLQPDSPKRREIEARLAEIDVALNARQHQLVAPPQGTIGPGEHTTSDRESGSEATTPEATPSTTTPAAVTPPSGTAPSDEAAAARGRTLKIAGIVVGVAGLALVGAGIGVGVDSLSARDSFAHPTPGQTYDPSLEQRANTNDIIALTVGVVGVAAVAVGATLLVLGVRAGHPEGAHALVVPVVSPHHAGAAFTLAF